MPPVSRVRSTGYGGLRVRKKSSIRSTSGLKKLAPGGAGRYIKVETMVSPPAEASIRAAMVVSSTWPLRIAARTLAISAGSRSSSRCARKMAAEDSPSWAETRSTMASSSWEAAWHEVQSLLDAEIDRLPAACREPFVTCCLI